MSKTTEQARRLLSRPRRRNAEERDVPTPEPHLTHTANAGNPSCLRIAALLLLIATASAIAYLPAIDHGFVNWDDPFYVSGNAAIRDLDLRTLPRFFGTDRVVVGNYHPLTMISLALDHRIHGAEPTGYHVANILLHIANTLLVFWLVHSLIQIHRTANQDAFSVPGPSRQDPQLLVPLIASALFGLHPLHVESVAWISQRKDVLYALFLLSASIAYVKYLQRRKTSLYLLTFALFTASLLSKALAASFPLTLLAIDYLAHRRLRNKIVILEKLPFFLVSLLLGIVAIEAQRQSGALTDEAVFSSYQHVAIAGHSLAQYFLKSLLPIHLSAVYSYPPKVHGSIPTFYYLVAVGAISVISLSVWWFRRNRIIVFGILFFLINIALVLQLIPVGNSPMADRYSYVPSIGLFLLLGVFCRYVADRTHRTWVLGVLWLYLGALGYSTYARCGVWENSMTLWNDVLARDKTVYVAWGSRGAAKIEAADFVNAISDLNHALRLKPDYFQALANRGIAKKNLGMLDEAIEDYGRSLNINSAYDVAYSNRGNARAVKGDLAGAIGDYDKAIALNPNSAQTYSNRGIARLELGQIDGAIEDLTMAVRLFPELPELHFNLGNAYLSKLDFESAIEAYDQAIRLRSNFAVAHSQRARAIRGREARQRER